MADLLKQTKELQETITLTEGNTEYVLILLITCLEYLPNYVHELFQIFVKNMPAVRKRKNNWRFIKNKK